MTCKDCLTSTFFDRPAGRQSRNTRCPSHKARGPVHPGTHQWTTGKKVSHRKAEGTGLRPNPPTRSHWLNSETASHHGAQCSHQSGGGPWREAARHRPVRACGTQRALLQGRRCRAGVCGEGRARRRRLRQLPFAGMRRLGSHMRRARSPTCPRPLLVKLLWQILLSTSTPRQTGRRWLRGCAYASAC